jgi:hypothetical protein
VQRLELCVCASAVGSSCTTSHYSMSKLQRHGVSHPLYCESSLKLVLSYVGPGQQAFIASVHRTWREICQQDEGLSRTFYRAVFANASRVTLAGESGWFGEAAGTTGDGEVLEEGDQQIFAAMQHAAGLHARIDNLRLAHKLGLPLTSHVSAGAAAACSLPKLRYLSEQGCCWRPTSCLPFAQWGNQVMLSQLESLGFMCDYSDWRLTAAAAGSKNVELMQWLNRNKDLCLEADIPAMRAAIRSDCVPMVEYIHSQGYKLHKDLIMIAIEADQFEALSWLNTQKCPSTGTPSVVLAARCGAMRILQRIFELIGDAMVPHSHKLLNAAGACGMLEAAQWLRSQGAEWPPVLREKGKSWCGEVLAWARAQGCESPVSLP